MGLNPHRFPLVGPMAVEPTCFGGFIGDMPVLRVGKLMGLLGLWLCFHKAYPPQFPFGSHVKLIFHAQRSQLGIT